MSRHNRPTYNGRGRFLPPITSYGNQTQYTATGTGPPQYTGGAYYRGYHQTYQHYFQQNRPQSQQSSASSRSWVSSQSSAANLQEDFQQMHLTKKPRPSSSRSQSRQSVPDLKITDRIQVNDPIKTIRSKQNDLKAILFLDLDNFGNFFEMLDDRLPNTLYIIGFNGGQQSWRAKESLALHNHVACNLFSLKLCGSEKNAADKELVTLAQKIDRILYPDKSFLILSKHCTYYKFIGETNRYVQIQDPLQKKLQTNIYHAQKIDEIIMPRITFIIISGDGGFFNYLQNARRHVQILNPHKTLVKEYIYSVIINHLQY